jgi:hypothetical protein
VAVDESPKLRLVQKAFLCSAILGLSVHSGPQTHVGPVLPTSIHHVIMAGEGIGKQCFMRGATVANTVVDSIPLLISLVATGKMYLFDGFYSIAFYLTCPRI